MFEVNEKAVKVRGDGWLEVHQRNIGTGRFRLDRVGECWVGSQDQEFQDSPCRYLTIKFMPVAPVQNEWDSVVRIAFRGPTEAEEWMRQHIPSVLVEKR